MTRRSRIAVLVVVIAACVAWGLLRMRPTTDAGSPGPASKPADRAGSSAPAPVAPTVRPGPAAPRDREVTIAGRVIEIERQQPVGHVEVVFRGASSEVTTTSDASGAYSIRLAAGSYRAFVRDEAVLSVGLADRVRLPGAPSLETAGVPDEALMMTVIANGDSGDIDLSVSRGGGVAGRVVDRDGRPIAGAVVRAQGDGFRPALATDIAESDRAGHFELRLPAGPVTLDASHPRFAGIESAAEAQVVVVPGRTVPATLSLVAGCVITGRVVGPDGSAAGDGALEKQQGEGDHQFGPAGRIEADGTFRWVTTAETEVTLRAWPWKSPASPGRRFACSDGARFDGVVFRIAERAPDMDGVLVDHAGEPVGFAFLDVAPIGVVGGLAQQERTDAAGRWAVYHMPPGRYRIAAHAEGRGITATTIVSPRSDVRLTLGGVGRLEGTTTRLASGSFELALATCTVDDRPIPLPPSSRLVTVSGGRFTVDDLPACELAFGVTWRGRSLPLRATIPSGGVAHLEIDLGPPRAKTVHGMVRDGNGKPVAGALVTAIYQTTDETAARTDDAGAYTLETFSNARLRATAPGLIGFAQVGGANIDREQVDLVVDDASDVEVD